MPQEVSTPMPSFWRHPIRYLYLWVLSWARSPWSGWGLFGLAFAESSFFPIPPDVLLIALGISIPKKAFKYALICTLGSLLGAGLGYLLGWAFYEAVGQSIIGFYGLESGFARVQDLYNQNAWLALIIAGFTPIPYKVFTLAAGVCRISLPVFFLASAIGRAGRFFLVGALIYLFGARIKTFIDKYFNLLTIIFTVLFILGFIVIKWVV